MDGSTSMEHNTNIIRTPIYKGYCDCSAVKMISVDGCTHFVDGDSATIDELREFLDREQCCTAAYIRYNGSDDTLKKIEMFISVGIPVNLDTGRLPSMEVMELLSNVPHSSVMLRVHLLSIPEKMPYEMIEVLKWAKAHKVAITLRLAHYPHFINRFDLYEFLERIKIYIGHILLEFPDISDELYHSGNDHWEDMRSGSLEMFKQMYIANVYTRSWSVKPRTKAYILYELSEFLATRKVTMDVIESITNIDNRLRVCCTGLSVNPMGMRPFFYRKEEGIFHPEDNQEAYYCSVCNTLLIG